MNQCRGRTRWGLMVMSSSVLSRRLWTECCSTRVSKQGTEAMMYIRKKGESEWLIPHRPAVDNRLLDAPQDLAYAGRAAES
jgi:hypothetical protein